MSLWQPSASLPQLQQRAQLNHYLRNFFADRHVLEVEVPALSRAAVSDPHIDSINASVCGETLYLQTSPEFFLKRLLAAGSGDVYSLGRVFRNGEAGRRHNPEFTMLEWYRVGWDDQRLMDEVADLLHGCLTLGSTQRLSYQELFERELGIDPHVAGAAELEGLVKTHIEIDLQSDDRDLWLDLLMSHVLEPCMGDGLVLLYDFPASQAALARLGTNARGQSVAKRFEAYVGGIELANGYWELCDADEQAARLQRDLHKRQTLGLPQYPVDQHLLQALAAGMPDCAGVAMGVDRLLMLQGSCDDIRKLLAFPFERV
ncbi:EF-P lysine aminoacylase EpmA [Pseudomaricurvus sp. HS19]|uniref:EF-P lysine aminoacylase EpmA n=1 Tax=Pseudomaricurvus sp. HS19 TaxID=2692626 RepID=UPI001370743A|nr:EF-P lysine aminoacylase EpmA [Pseudomaricurvus sp. HS19]MYM64258.1 EF-P lysine aminoacylase GenX [Pseudomaricurvus sp. HS19]